MPGLHLAILLFGTAGLLGRELSLDPLAIAGGRSLIAGLVLGALLLRPGRRDAPLPGWRWTLAGGALLALHWSCFFAAVKQGGVPLALLSYAAFPAFGLLLECLWPLPPGSLAPGPAARAGRRWHPALLLGLMTAGLLLLAGPRIGRDLPRLGALGMGVAAGAAFALLARLNAARLPRFGALPLAAAQMGGAALWLLPATLPAVAAATPRDWFLLLLLGLAGTALAHTLFIRALARASPFQAGVAAGLEPVYGVLLAALVPPAPLWHEWAALPPLVLAALLAVPRAGRCGASSR